MFCFGTRAPLQIIFHLAGQILHRMHINKHNANCVVQVSLKTLRNHLQIFATCV